VHDVLHDQVIEQKAEDGAVVPAREEFAEPVAIQPPSAGPALVDAVEKVHLARVRETLDRFVV